MISFISTLELLAEQSPLLFLILDVSLKASLLLVATFAIHIVLYRQSASAKSTLWLMSFTALLFLPLFHSVLPNFPILLNFHIVAESVGESAANNVQGALPGFSLLGIDSAELVPGVLSKLDWISGFYILVVLVLAFYLLVGIIRVVLLSHLSQEIKCSNMQRLLQTLRDRNGISSRVDLLVSDRITSPLTWGVRRHKIIFPVDALNWNQKLLEQIISHELGHIERRDWLNQLLSRLVACMYWINPLVWLAQRKFNTECEKVCDDVAVDDTGCSISYAENLLWLVRKFHNCRATLAPAFFGNSSPLMQRIQHILNVDKQRHYINRNSSAPSMVAAIMFAAVISSLHLSAQVIEQPAQQRILIPIKYYPKDSAEFNLFRSELEILSW